MYYYIIRLFRTCIGVNAPRLLQLVTAFLFLVWSVYHIMPKAIQRIHLESHISQHHQQLNFLNFLLASISPHLELIRLPSVKMRFSTTAAILCALCSAVTATPSPGSTPANLQARQPISKVGTTSANGRPNRLRPCSDIGEHCSCADDCCGALLCGGSGCFQLKALAP